jgi:hypothetical protein
MRQSMSQSTLLSWSWHTVCKQLVAVMGNTIYQLGFVLVASKVGMLPTADGDLAGAYLAVQVEPQGLQGGYASVQPGDCIVAFSRRDIYDIKQQIEQETTHRTCVVYGALPPETRRMQAKLFNEPGGWHCGLGSEHLRMVHSLLRVKPATLAWSNDTCGGIA